MTKIGIMSFAHLHADGYAPCLKALPGAELAAIWDDDPERGHRAAERHETAFEPDLGAFLASDIQGVIITSENAKHRTLTEQAAAAGKWVLSEKPLATTIEGAQAMIDVCRNAGVGLGTAFPCRYAQPLVEVKNQIQNGDLGTVYAATCTNHGRFPGGWFAVGDLAGGGATMDHTVHVVDLLRWMLEKEFTRVYCENGRLLGRDTDLDDIGVLHLENEDGFVASHIASWSRPASFPTWGDVTIEFIGEKGTVRVDGFRQKIDVYDDGRMRMEWAHWGANPDQRLVADFVAAVAERREPAITGYDGLKALEVTVAAYESTRTGQMTAV